MYPPFEQMERNRTTAAHFGMDVDRSSPVDAVEDLARFCRWAVEPVRLEKAA
jgi:hypothetical protein